MYICCHFQWKTENRSDAQVISLNLLNYLLTMQIKVCRLLFVYEKTIESYPFANRLNGLN